MAQWLEAKGSHLKPATCKAFEVSAAGGASHSIPRTQHRDLIPQGHYRLSSLAFQNHHATCRKEAICLAWLSMGQVPQSITCLWSSIVKLRIARAIRTQSTLGLFSCQEEMGMCRVGLWMLHTMLQLTFADHGGLTDSSNRRHNSHTPQKLHCLQWKLFVAAH